MKNLKTKIGITITALACFLTFGCNSKKPDMQEESQEYNNTATTLSPITVQEPKYEPSPYDKCDFEKITGTLKQSGNISLSYALPDGRIVEFSYHDNETDERNLKLQVSKQIGNNIEKVIITDYCADGLDGYDIIGYFSGTSLSLTKQELETKKVKFEELSEEVQKKITEEYATILKDAPERLSKKYEELVKSFEKDVLGILKK